MPILNLRLKDDEWKFMEEMRGAMTRGEFVRKLMAETYRKSKGLSKVKPAHYQESNRKGAFSWGVLSWSSVETASDATKVKPGPGSRHTYGSGRNGVSRAL